MSSELAHEVNRLVSQADAVSQDARNVFGSLTKEQLNWKPSPERWSVAMLEF